MTCYIMPSDAVAIVIVERGQARLIVELLQTLDCHPYVEFSLNRSLFQTLKIVWLWHSVPGAKIVFHLLYAMLLKFFKCPET